MAVALTLFLAVAFFVPLGPIAGLAVLVVGLGLTSFVLLSTALTIRVTPERLFVGKANIEWPATGIVATLDEQSTLRARTVESDPRAFDALRPLSARTAVTIEVVDDEDPHPYWLISTRHPEELGEAIVAAQHSYDSLTATRP